MMHLEIRTNLIVGIFSVRTLLEGITFTDVLNYQNRVACVFLRIHNITFV